MKSPYTVDGAAFDTLQAAFNAAKPGGAVQATGTIRNDAAVLRTPNVTLRGPAVLDARGTHAEGKAVIVVKAPGFVVERIEALNIAVPDGNGALIRFEADGDLTLRRCHVHDGQQGILTNNDLAKGRVILEDCVFERLGDGSGRTHNIYIGRIAELRIRGGRYNDAFRGHCIKSRAAKTIIQGAQIHEGRASRAIDVPNGGVVEIAECDIMQSQETGNWDIIGYGHEGKVWPQNAFHFYASNKITNSRRPPGETFAFKFEPDVKVIENFTVGKPEPPPVAAATLVFVPRRDASGTVTNWGDLPPNTWAEIDGTRMDQLQPLIRPDFVDYGSEKFRAICDGWGGAALDGERGHLFLRSLGRSDSNNNGTYRLNYRTMVWDIVDQPSAVTRSEIEEANAFHRARLSARLVAQGKSEEAAKAQAAKAWDWRYALGATYDGGDAYRDGKPAGSHSYGKIVWLARRQRMLISISHYWELEPGRGWQQRGPALGNAPGAALFEDDKTGHVFHAYVAPQDYWRIHEWDPESSQYVGQYNLNLKPPSKYHFNDEMRPCLVGRDIFVLYARTGAFAFNLDSRSARAVELDQLPLVKGHYTCVAHGGRVLVLADSGHMWEIDLKAASCKPFAAKGAFGAHPRNSMYSRARVWKGLLLAVATTHQNVRVMRLQ